MCKLCPVAGYTHSVGRSIVALLGQKTDCPCECLCERDDLIKTKNTVACKKCGHILVSDATLEEEEDE